MSFIVRTKHQGAQFWLRGTTWAFSEDRAQRFDSIEEASSQLEKSRRFNRVAAYRSAEILGVLE